MLGKNELSKKARFDYQPALDMKLTSRLASRTSAIFFKKSREGL